MVKKGSKTILIVDDDPVIVRMLEKILERDGYNILKAYNGKDGLKIAKEKLPFLIVLDVLMPDESGMDIAKKLQDHPKTKGIPIVFLTITIPLEKDKGKEAVAVGSRTFRAMAKPMHTAKLLAIIRKEVNKRIHGNK